MSPVTFETACIHYAAWLGAMLERIARGKRPLPKPWDVDAIYIEARSFGPRQNVDDPWPEPRHVPAIDLLMRRVCNAIRGSRFEDYALVAIFMESPSTPPSDLVHPVIDRGDKRLLTALGHGIFDDDVQWRLTEWDTQSVYHLALRRYGHPKYEAHRFEEVIFAFQWPDVVDYLRNITPSSPDKADVLISYASRMSDWPRLHAPYRNESRAYREAIDRWQAQNAG